jgi:hypothetical protein
LQQEDGSLRGPSPHKLAAFSLAILHINVPSGEFKAAILENTIDEHAFVENNVLVFKSLVFKSVHYWIFPLFQCDRKKPKLRPKPRGYWALVIFSPAQTG